MDPNFPCGQSVRNCVKVSTDNRIKSLKNDFNGYFELTPGSIAIDYGHRLEDYLSVVYHGVKLFNNKLEMKELVIGFIQSSTEKTADVIWSEINEAVKTLDIVPEQINSMVGISDEGSNVIKALKLNFDERKSPCIYHVHCYNF